MDNQPIPQMPTIKLSRLKKMIASLENSGSPIKDPDLNFEYIVGSLYPTLYKNIMNEINHQYTLGYLQGREDMKNEIEGTN